MIKFDPGTLDIGPPSTCEVAYVYETPHIYIWRTPAEAGVSIRRLKIGQTALLISILAKI